MGIASNEFDRIASTQQQLSEERAAAIDGSAFPPLGQGFTSSSVGVVESEYYVINWIDSKAMFADVATFEEHLEQLKGYNNRYGRGLVIYWHGCSVEVYRRLQDDMIIVRDSFPSDWINPCSQGYY